MKKPASVYDFIPPEFHALIDFWTTQYDFHLKFAGSRNTKLGFFKPSLNGKPAIISLNSDLNPYAFLITFAHELAHLIVFERYGRQHKPHGKEWKETYRDLLLQILKNPLPARLDAAVKDYARNPRASTSGHQLLAKTLKDFDEKMDDSQLLENLNHNATFRIYNGKCFVKKERVRKRYRCICLDNKKIYLIQPHMQVYPL